MIYQINDKESAAKNLFQFLFDNGCEVTLDEDAASCLPQSDMGGWGSGAKAEAYYDAVCAVDGYATLRYVRPATGQTGWVQLAIGWGNQPWEEVPDYSITAGADDSMADRWHTSYQERIGDRLTQELHAKLSA